MSADEPITIHRHYHAARPLTVTRANCMDVLGVEPGELSALLRRLGVTNKGTNKNPMALLADVEAARLMAIRGIATPPRQTLKISGEPLESVIAKTRPGTSKEACWLDPPVNVPPEPVVYVLSSGEFIKVGWTSRFASRWKTYKTCNPIVMFVAAWPGDRGAEAEALRDASAIATSLEAGWRGGGQEWFVTNNELLAWAHGRNRDLFAWWAECLGGAQFVPVNVKRPK